MKIGLATSGLRAHTQAIELLSGGQAVRLGLLAGMFGIGVDAVAGWGHKPTADRARRIAARHNLPYLAFEDGFLRSVRPGNDEKPLSMILDRSGIYYDAREPSDLETLVRERTRQRLETGQTPPEVLEAMLLLRNKRLSKYNSFEMTDISALGLRDEPPENRVLVIDQTAGDASIAGAFASEASFAQMLATAAEDNPHAEILVKVHPETIIGRKTGHFSQDALQVLAQSHPAIAEAQTSGRLRLTPEAINPWALLEACTKVYCVSSQLGFEALMAACEVHCFGAGFYAGYGLTRDHFQAPSPTAETIDSASSAERTDLADRRGKASLEDLFGALYLDYCHYLEIPPQADHPAREISFFEAVDRLSERIEKAG